MASAASRRLFLPQGLARVAAGPRFAFAPRGTRGCKVAPAGHDNVLPGVTDGYKGAQAGIGLATGLEFLPARGRRRDAKPPRGVPGGGLAYWRRVRSHGLVGSETLATLERTPNPFVRPRNVTSSPPASHEAPGPMVELLTNVPRDDRESGTKSDSATARRRVRESERVDQPRRLRLIDASGKPTARPRVASRVRPQPGFRSLWARERAEVGG